MACAILPPEPHIITNPGVASTLIWVYDGTVDQLGALHNNPYKSDILLKHKPSGRSWFLHSDVFFAIAQSIPTSASVEALSDVAADVDRIEDMTRMIYAMNPLNGKPSLKTLGDFIVSLHLMDVLKLNFDPFIQHEGSAVLATITDPASFAVVANKLADLLVSEPLHAKVIGDVFVHALNKFELTQKVVPWEAMEQFLRFDGSVPAFDGWKTRIKSVIDKNTGWRIVGGGFHTPELRMYGMPYESFSISSSDTMLMPQSSSNRYKLGRNVFGHHALGPMNVDGLFSKVMADAAAIKVLSLTICNLLPPPNFCIKLAASRSVFMVHDWILYCEWRYFKTMVSSSIAAEIDAGEMTLDEDISAEQMSYFLRSIYGVSMSALYSEADRRRISSSLQSEGLIKRYDMAISVYD